MNRRLTIAEAETIGRHAVEQVDVPPLAWDELPAEGQANLCAAVVNLVEAMRQLGWTVEPPRSVH